MATVEVVKTADRVVQIDKAFVRVENTLEGFVKDYGAQFPGLIPFRAEWNAYKLSWNTYIIASKDFATKTAAKYDDYTLQLTQVDHIITKEDMDELAANLADFGKSHPVGILIDLYEKFLSLRRDVRLFQERFNKYLNAQGAQLTERANKLKSDIEPAVAEIKSLDEQPLGAAIADKQNEDPLARMRAEFAALVPEFNILDENLGFFADTWNEFYKEAQNFAASFEKTTTPAKLVEIYKARVQFAKQASVSLSKGLRDYASSI